MTHAGQWARLRELFGDAVALDGDARDRFVEEQCAGDPELRSRLLALIEAHETGGLRTGMDLPSSATAADEPPDPLIGVTIGDYRVLEPIGEGGMGRVYRAFDLRLERYVALKTLPEAFAGDQTRAARFKREALVLASVSHGNIAPIFDVQEYEGRLVLVLELVEGHTLAEHLRAGPLARDEAIAIALQVTAALAAAHAAGVVHRDLKPANIAIAPDGSVKVLDFGIAKTRGTRPPPPGGTPDAAHEVTAPGLRLGTTAYMSPEQIRGLHIDERTDVWSFGVVLFEMLAGARPFGSSDPADTVARILGREPDWSALPRETPAYLRTLLERCLEKTARRRLQAIGEARITLESAAGHAAFSGRPRASPRRRVMTALPYAALLAIVVFALIQGAMAPALPSPDGTGDTAGSGPAALDVTRVAVLYFDDHSPAGDLGYLAAGLTEELIHQLSQVPALDVVSRNGSKLFRNEPAPLDSMVAVLGAGTFVEGSVQRSGDQLRVTVQLIDGADGTHMVSRTLERPWDELFALQQGLVEAVAMTLRERLGEAVQLQTQRRTTRSVDAWESLQQARVVEDQMRSELRKQGIDTTRIDRALEEADDLLAAAVVADHDWPDPWVQRGWLWTGTVVEGTGEYALRSLEVLKQRTDSAVLYAEHALALEPRHPGALELHGFLSFVRWNLGISATPETRQRAQADLQAAVQADPSRARAWRLLSDIAMKTGDFPSARAYGMRALEEDAFLDDVQDIYYGLYETALNLEDIEEAEYWCEEGGRRLPGSIPFALCPLTTRASLPGDPSGIPETWELFENYMGVTQAAWARASGLSLVAAALAHAGLPDSARAVVARARDELPENDVLVDYFDYYDAYVATVSGDHELAIDLLTEFVSAYPSRREFLPSDWWFRPLWDHPRFLDITSSP